MFPAIKKRDRDRGSRKPAEAAPSRQKRNSLTVIQNVAGTKEKLHRAAAERGTEPPSEQRGCGVVAKIILKAIGN